MEAVHAFQPLRSLAARPYDVIHAHFGPTANLIAWLRHLGLLDGSILSSFHGFDVTVLPGRDPNGDYNRLFSRAERFTANTTFLRDRLVALGAPPDRVDVLPIGIDPSRIRFHAERSTSDGPRLLTVARLVECKGIDRALQAVQRLVPEWPRLRYTIIGEGPLRSRLEQLCATLGLGGHVRFVGALPFQRVVDAYHEHDIFLLPGVTAEDGHVEAQGRVLLEAQAAGLAVVATDVGGVSEVMAPGATFLLPPNDDQAIVQAIRSILDEPAALPSRATAAREFVDRNFDSRRLHVRLLEIYRDLTGGDAA